MQKIKFDPKNYDFDKNYFAKIDLLAEQLGDQWKKKLLYEITYKDPILWPYVVSNMVWDAIQPSSKDAKSVLVYAILTEQTEEAMLAYMIKDGK